MRFFRPSSTLIRERSKIQSFRNAVQSADIRQLNPIASEQGKNSGTFSCKLQAIVTSILSTVCSYQWILSCWMLYARYFRFGYHCEWYMPAHLPMKSWCALLECRNIGSLVSSANWNCFSKYLETCKLKTTQHHQKIHWWVLSTTHIQWNPIKRTPIKRTPLVKWTLISVLYVPL